MPQQIFFIFSILICLHVLLYYFKKLLKLALHIFHKYFFASRGGCGGGGGGGCIFYWPFKLSSWQWYSSYSIWKLSPSDNVLQMQSSDWIPSSIWALVWDFKRAGVNAITIAINQVDWKFMFSYKNIHQQVNLFNKAINIFSNFIPNKLVTFDDKDPPWMTEKLKEKIK